MKKRILILIIVLLGTTGCTCEYNLTINENSYIEQINIIGEIPEEISNFNNDWQISIDKYENDRVSNSDSPEIKVEGEIYNYQSSQDKLSFNYNFNTTNFANSTAVSMCYNKLTVSSYNDTIIMSTSPKASCFEKYPTLTNVKVNIKTDREVISNNADNVNGNIYTWNITKENANKKSINIVLDNSIELENVPSSSQKPTIKKKKDYSIYIFSAILIVIILLVYLYFNNLKKKNNNIE